MTAQPAERTREVFRFGTYAWDVTLAEEITQGRDTLTINPEDAGSLFLIHINEAHAATVDLTKPVIVAPIPGADGNLIIDGWHRVWKARITGVTSLPAVLLTPDEEHQVRLHGGGKGPSYYR